MIIDVHSHTPQFRHAVPPENRRLHHTWRPDRSVDSVYSWNDFLEVRGKLDPQGLFRNEYLDRVLGGPGE